ncbi:MAG: hypothetical protein AVDCRST_MAG30-1735, partial [uncultured Solirubrobacteraceae bacterium]
CRAASCRSRSSPRCSPPHRSRSPRRSRRRRRRSRGRRPTSATTGGSWRARSPSASCAGSAPTRATAPRRR